MSWKFVPLRVAVPKSSLTCDCRLHHLADVEGLGSLVGEHVEQFSRVWRLVRVPQVLVSLIQLCPDVVQSNALVPETLITPVSTLLNLIKILNIKTFFFLVFIGLSSFILKKFNILMAVAKNYVWF